MNALQLRLPFMRTQHASDSLHHDRLYSLEIGFVRRFQRCAFCAAPVVETRDMPVALVFQCTNVDTCKAQFNLMRHNLFGIGHFYRGTCNQSSSKHHERLRQHRLR